MNTPSNPKPSKIFDFPTFGLPMKTFTRLQSSRRSLIDLKFLISTQLRKLLVFGVVFSMMTRRWCGSARGAVPRRDPCHPIS